MTMSFNSPAKKRRRRSSFFDKQSIRFHDSSILDFAEPRDNKLQSNVRIKQLKEEKQKWIDLERKLREKVHGLKSKKSSGEYLPRDDVYLEYLSTEDKEYLNIVDTKLQEYDYLCNSALPKIKETILLTQYECKKQLTIEKLLLYNYELLIYTSLKNFDRFEDNIEILGPYLATLNEDSSIYDETCLCIEGI